MNTDKIIILRKYTKALRVNVKLVATKNYMCIGLFAVAAKHASFTASI